MKYYCIQIVPYCSYVRFSKIKRTVEKTVEQEEMVHQNLLNVLIFQHYFTYIINCPWQCNDLQLLYTSPLVVSRKD